MAFLLMIMMGCCHGEFFLSSAGINKKHRNKMSSITYKALLFLGLTLPESHEERDCFLYFTDGK